LTYRGISESFWVITGATKAGVLSEDLYKAVNTNATVVVLMGYAKLKEIIELYTDNGKAELPIALIQNGSLPNEKIVLGRVEDILEKAEASAIGVPAIIVLGEVVAKHLEFEQIKEEIQVLEF
jgi:uroporphyrin-III C-methyltransferase